MTNYLHILGRITNTPLMVTADYLSSALSVISQRMDTSLIIPESMDQPAYTSRRPEGLRAISNGIATINISGSLAHKGGNMQGASTEMRSYDAIKSDFDAAMNDDKVTGIALEIDSPGGEVAGNFSLVRHIASSRGTKPIWAFVNEFATSAAYNIAAAADKVVGPQEMYVGSIGVVTAHVSQEKMLDNAGIKVTYIHAGDHKVDGNSANDLTDEVKADIQGRINTVYKNFVSTVAENRGVQAIDIQKTEARIYSGLEAKDRGLVDEIMSTDEAFATFCEHCNGASQTITTGNTMSGKQGVVQDAVVAGSNADDNYDQGLAAGKLEGEKVGFEKGITAGRAHVVSILKLHSANISANHQSMALEYADMGMSVEQADGLLKKQAIVKAAAPEPEQRDALAEAMSSAKLEGEEVDATPGQGDEPDEMSSLLADATQFKADTSSFVKYAESKNVQ